MTIEVCHILSDLYQTEKLLEIAGTVNTLTASSGGVVVPDTNYRNEKIKMLKNDINISVAAGAIQKVVLDLGADWQDYKFLVSKGFTVTGQTAASKSISLPHATRFCTDAAGTTQVEDYIYTPSGHFMTCKNWSANTEDGFSQVHSGPVGSAITASWVSTTQAYQSLLSDANFQTNNATNLDTHLIIKGRYVAYVYKNTDTATHTLTTITAFLHCMDKFGY